MVDESKTPPKVAVVRPADDSVILEFSGDWKAELHPPSVDLVQQEIDRAGDFRRMAFDSTGLTGWDSNLLAFLIKIYAYCDLKGIEKSPEGLPAGAARLIALALAVPEQDDARKAPGRKPILMQIGEESVTLGRSTLELLSFIGEASVSFVKLLSGKARFRKSMLAVLMEECGARALPIVSLISLLVGLILAFVGAIQLRLFGAQIYVADLVGLAMSREMGAMMTGIIMAGRTGAAFAAQLGTMQVNEEIDAFKTMGISPMEFLVLPRMIALAVMMPFLCIYANLMGMLGGGIVAVGMLDISPAQYYHETLHAVQLVDFGVGVVKSSIFGILVAMSGCLRGIQCGRSADAVGDATTSAVVTAIVAIIVSDALMTVLCEVLGI